ncbi:prenyltransferase/squalene oxidase repeat-containing protein [Streptomyces sp. NPDC002092]
MAGELPTRGLFSLALERRSAEFAADDLRRSIQKAIDDSIAFLGSHSCTENGMKGWNQYQDGTRVGVISSAQALLSHSYAGVGSDVLHETAATLESLQNPDGGWQVRRALVGAASDVSITESTSFCLMALHASGRTASNPSAQRGLAWLTSMQRPDGGWSSSESGEAPNVVATAWAARVLVAFDRAEPARRGVEWLRTAQNADGGWGPVAMRQTSEDGESNSSPAYTAHAILALVALGVQPGDRAVDKACEYLDSAFDPAQEEPWVSTSFTTLVDAESYARLDFRHFATPWALSALSAAGRDLGDKTVLLGTLRLLRAQAASGAWRSGLTAPGDYPVWACHDALFALKSVTEVSSRRLDAVIMASHLRRERDVLEESVLSPSSPRGVARRVRSSYVTTAWMSLLTVAVILLLLVQFNVIEAAAGDSMITKIVKWGAAAVFAVVGALAPPILAEEYKIRRQGNANPPHGGEGT